MKKQFNIPQISVLSMQEQVIATSGGSVSGNSMGQGDPSQNGGVRPSVVNAPGRINSTLVPEK